MTTEKKKDLVSVNDFGYVKPLSRNYMCYKICIRYPVGLGATYSPVHQNVQISSGIYLAFYSMGNGILFLGKVART